MDLRKNNFDLLRLLFASSVLFWHAHLLSKSEELEVLSRIFSVDLAVKAFFVVSGYLVVMSCERSASLAEYAGKRFRRIYPAYAAVVCACALLGLAFSARPPAEYFSADLLRYLAANLVFLNFLSPTLPGAFSANPWGPEVNGALWTLKIEVMFYAAVPAILYGVRRWGTGVVLTGLYALSVAYAAGIALASVSYPGRLPWEQLARQLPGQLTYFIGGAALYLYRVRAERKWPALLVAALGAYLLEAALGHAIADALLAPVWLSILVVFAARGLPYLGNFARFGDFSYGVYIIHFPVLQAFAAAGLFSQSPWRAFAGAALVTLALAFASWHLVEKPFLAKRSHYRAAEGHDGETLERPSPPS